MRIPLRLHRFLRACLGMTTIIQNTRRLPAALLGALGFIFFAAFLVWLYYPALFIFFASDDWVLINHVKDIPASEPWRYFSLKAVWFYRPLQTLQYGLTYHAAGLNPIPYNVQLLVMHIIASALAWLLLRLLFGAGIATVAAMLFSVSEFASETVLWKANFNTVQNAILTFATCCFFVKYLRNRKRSWLCASVITVLANWLTKESGINLPVILGSVWLTCYLQNNWERPTNLNGGIENNDRSTSIRSFLASAVRDLWIFAALATVYVGLRKLLFENVESRYEIIYRFVSPGDALKQLLHAINRSLFSFTNDPLLLAHVSGFWTAVDVLSVFGYALPGGLIWIGFWRKNSAIIFAVIFAAAAQVPTFALENFFESRYYYMSVLGGMVFVAAVLWPTIKALILSDRGYHRTADIQLGKVYGRASGYFSLFALLWMFLGSLVLAQEATWKISLESQRVEAAFYYVEEIGEHLPYSSMIIIKNVSGNFFYNGFGAMEIVQIATDRSDVAGLVGDNANYKNLKLENPSWKNWYILNVQTSKPALQQLP